MKKALLLAVLFVTSAPLFAQWYRIPLQINVKRAVAQKQSSQPARPEWTRKLGAMEKHFGSILPHLDWDRFPIKEVSSLTLSQETKYAQRVLKLQQQLSQNAVLKKYTFVSPRQEDLATLSAQRFFTLQQFLQKPNASAQTVAKFDQVRPFTLAVSLGKNTQEALEIWIDVPTQHVYLMSNNLYTTAKARYGLHLK